MEFKLYSKSLRQIEEKNYKGALKSINRYLHYFPESPRIINVLCHKAVVYSELNDMNEAVDAYYTALRIDSFNTEIYKLRGNLYVKNKNFNAALKDFNTCIRLDSNMGEAYASKANIYKNQGSQDLACGFYSRALQHGYQEALAKIKESCDTNSIVVSRYLLKTLDVKSIDSDYGYSEFKPIKIGGNNFERLELYLSQLRDKNGYPLKFTHLSTCCPYKSNYGTFGKGLCETYEVIINNDRRILYLSIYDYEEPKIPTGLYSTFHFKE